MNRRSTTRAVYESGSTYTRSNVSIHESDAPDDYVGRLLREKLALIRRHLRPGPIVDLCCATGQHLAAMPNDRPRIGVDFCLAFLQDAETPSNDEAPLYLAADARSLPLASDCIGTLYSLSALYQVPQPEQYIAEIARVLKVGGRCVLDLGVAHSLNAYCVVNHHPELPPSHYLTVTEIRRLFAKHSLRIIEHRRYQLLPLWTNRPSWLWPLLHPIWRRIMAIRVCGRMIDAWLCAAPVLKCFAFRHLVVGEKC